MNTLRNLSSGIYILGIYFILFGMVCSICEIIETEEVRYILSLLFLPVMLTVFSILISWEMRTDTLDKDALVEITIILLFLNLFFAYLARG